MSSERPSPPADDTETPATTSSTPAATTSGRQALLAATITVVAESGLRALTYRAVAAEAGVSHGLVRHHFGTRDQLIAEALSFAVDESLRETNMAGRGAPGDTAHFAEGLASLASRSTAVQAFQYELLLESRRRPELRPAVEQYYETYRRATRDRLLELGIDDDELIEVIWFALDGLVFKTLVLGVDADAERVLARIRRLVEEHATRS
ncbi:TetR family transcriptional regulator [Agromyces endophyticus]|uniref:TetR/AcrR family transcriptional regulator n=1 Tax=Agromyces sp. H17E-10 TaxID=2932244 RepID=UPI001FD3F7FB|nr:TetR family transcriptional regulator [Agromyces sp. H17E-10]UOQ89930.1 TetR family transcriptional regulator [Agromyces sp. H17E-10]